MPKKKENRDELFPDEQDNEDILKTTNMIKEPEEPEETIDTPRGIDQKEAILNLLQGAINLLNRNISNKDRAINNIQQAIKVLNRL